ncbi:hypothetical protein [Phaeobacter sp. 11ANDIMAR09]|uniref:hypothetical protein n=1 Tax=Phaeobacter sp. 11ANDIMAR09 TaxID=1225647 RepID=UPI0006C8E4B5|nr:hypothetical protein [Phaeobacter sp. 11ANDIMAR09]KPD10377.1 hypothetical protein AN476_21325 [Phaeobacter sp. 11ANDIMAR09]
MYTYAGLLDDVVQRYEPRIGQDHTFFSRNLAKHALFGQNLLINDGYIFAGDGFKQALSEGSMLRGMLRSHFAKVITKLSSFDADAFASLPERLAAQRVNTSQKLVAQSDWETDLKPSLRNLGKSIAIHGSHTAFPAFQMDAGFRKIFERIADKSLPDLGVVGISKTYFDDLMGDIQENEAYSTAPRSALEEELLQRERAGELNRSVTEQMMSIGCQAYHYNFALCLSASTGQAVTAETSLGRAFEDLLDLPDAAEAEAFGPSSHEIISMPKRFPYDRFDLFESFVEDGHSMHKAKSEFLNGVEEAIKGSLGNGYETSKLISELADMYRRKIVEHFVSKGINSDDIAPHWYRAGSFGLTFIVGKFQGDWAVASELPSFINPVLEEKPTLEAFVSKMHKGLTGVKDWQVRMLLNEGMQPTSGMKKSVNLTVRDIAPRYSSLGFNQNAVDKHTIDLPVFSA